MQAINGPLKPEHGESMAKIKSSSGEVYGYYSNRLTNIFISVIEDSFVFPGSIKKKLQKLVANKIVIPVYDHLCPFFDNGKINRSFGFYDHHRIYINVSARNFNEVNLYRVITHELQHAFAHVLTDFHKDSLVRNILKSWYLTVMKKYQDAFIECYKKIGVTPEDNIWFCQELFVPSEVLAICAEFNSHIGKELVEKYADEVFINKMLSKIK